MRKFLSFAAVLALLSGCAQSDGVNDRMPVAVDTPETLYAEFDNERGENEDETRTYVEDEWMLRWHEGDEISFFPVTYNMCYRFNGETGDNGGTFSKLTTDIITGNELPTRYAVYPYREDTKISDEGHITYYFPEEQQWAEKSFGRGANVMVAATENHDDNVLRFKNVGGYLKLQIYSPEQRWLDYLVLEGNNGERIAGEARIEAYYDGEPWVEMTENASTRITYDCVDTQHWVDLAISTDAENPTDLWIVLPPTYFDNGITVRIYDTEGNVCTKSTNNWIPIDRNYVQPLSTFEFVADGDNGGEDNPSYEEGVIYYDNFDGQEATKTFGSGSSWPYIDEFPEFANPEGPASENVTYTGSGVSVRSNSTSNGNYSDYTGSGLNNLFFGANAYFQINGIALDALQTSYKLTFGSEKYSPDGDSIFNNSEFHVMLSTNGYDWWEIEYTYAGTEGGRWNVATADITFEIVPETLYIAFIADVASAYRIDDVRLEVADGNNGGEEDAQIKIYGDVSATGWMNCNAWIWDDGGANYTGGTWPGLALEAEEVDGKMYYAFEVAPEMVGSTVNVIFNNGSEQTVDINGVELNDDVFITLTEVDASGKWLATVAYGAGEDEPAERSIVLNNVEHNAISFTVNHTGDYYLLLVEEEYLSLTGYTIDEFIAVFGAGDALVKASGTQSFDWHDGDTTELDKTIDIASDRAYYLAVAEFVDGTLVEGSIITTQFTTPPAPESSSAVAVELSDVTATSVYITATPDASIVQYYIYVRDRSWADNVISSYGESMLQNLVKYPSAGAWNLTEAYEGLWEGLSANTEYYLMVLAIDGDGAENFKYTSFTTGDEASNDTPGEEEPVIPVNPENCEWVNVYLSLPTEEDAANGFYPYQHIYITIEGTDIVAGRIALLLVDETSIEDALNMGQSFDPSWIERINSGTPLGLNAEVGPSMECRVVTELTNVNGDVVRFDQYITTDPLPEVHPLMDQWVGTWSVSAEQMINWTYVDGAYNGPTLIDGAVTRDITIEAATDIAYDCVRVYGLTSLTTSNGEPIPAFATVTNYRTLLFQSGTQPIEQINDSEFTYWLPYVQTSNGVEVIPAYSDALYLTLSEDGLTATTASRGSIEYNGEVCDVIGMDVFASDGYTVRTLYNPETMPEVITPAGNITMTRTSSAAKASYAPAKRAATRNMVQIELVK